MFYHANEADFKGSEERDEENQISQIKYIGEYFEKLSLEVDNKLLETSFYKPSQLEISKNLAKNQEIFKPRNLKDHEQGWVWFHEATRCFHTHCRNASFYHKFLQSMKDLPQEIENIKEECTKMKENKDVFVASDRMTMLLRRLLELQMRVDGAHEMSHRVVPIHLRKSPCQPQTRSIVSVGSYYDVQGKIVDENAEYHLLDNSDPSRWKVRSKNQKEFFVPSLVFVIPPPDADLMQEAYRLRWHLVSVWKFCVEEAKKNLSVILSMQLDREGGRKLQQLASAHKDKILETLDAAKNLLFNGERQTVEGSPELNDKIRTYTSDNFSDANQADAVSRVSMLGDDGWMGHHDLTQNIKDMDIYMKSYAGEVTSQVSSSSHLIRHDNSNNKPHFKSCAYIQRWPGRTANAAKKSKMMMIYEAGGAAPNFTSNLTGEVEEFVEERIKERQEETQFTSQTIKETERFFIEGVFDPRVGRNISSQQAIRDGVIDLKKGLYRNPVTGESILIPRAMEGGLIVVEYSNKSVEMGELIKSGMIRTFTTKEVVSYVVLSIRDPRTGKTISVGDALGSGIIDQEQGRYILNKDTGDSIPIQSAIEKGFLEVKEVNRRPIANEEPSNVKVVGVYDIVGKRFLPLQQALRKDVMDRNTAALRNKATGEVVPLKEAVRRGLVLLEVSRGNDANSLKNFPVLKKEDFEEIMGSVGEGYSADPTLELMNEVSDDLLFFDPTNNEQMSLKKAMISSRVRFDPLTVVLHDDTKILLHTALAKGILDLKGVRALLKVTEGKRSLQRLADDGRLDLNSGEYIDLATGERRALTAAVEAKHVDPSLLFYWDDQAGAVTSLKASLDNGRLKDGKLFDFANGEWITIEEAIGRRLIKLEVNTEELMEKYSSLLLFKDHLNGNNNNVQDAKVVGGLSVEDAILRGNLDLGGLRVSTGDGRFVSLSEAVRDELLSDESAEQILDVARKNDLNSFFVSHKTFDPSTGRMMHPTNSRKITFLQAVSDGIIDPNSVFVVDCTDGAVKSMKRLAAEGKFSLESGRIRDPSTGRERSLQDAIKNGLVKPTFEVDGYLRRSDTLESFMKFHPKKEHIQLKDGRKIALKEALESGYIDSTTRMKVDENSGCLLLDDDNEGNVLLCLKEISSLESLLRRFGDEFETLRRSKDTDLQHLEDFRKRLTAFKTDVDVMVGKFDELDSTGSQNSMKLKSMSNKLINTFQQLEDELDGEIETRKDLEERMVSVDGKLKEMRRWVDEIEEEHKTLSREASRPTTNLDDLLQIARNMDSSLQAKLEELLDVESCCCDLLDFATTIDAKKENVHGDRPIALRIDDDLKHLNDAFNGLSSDHGFLVENLALAARNWTEFKELEQLFSNKLSDVEDDVGRTSATECRDQNEKNERLKELNDWEGNLVELKSLRSDLESLANETESSFAKLGRTLDRRFVGVEHLDSLQGKVSSLQSQINKSLTEDEQKKLRVVQIRDELDDLERNLSVKKLSADRKKLLRLNEHLQSQLQTAGDLRIDLDVLINSEGDANAYKGLADRLQSVQERLQEEKERTVALIELMKHFAEKRDSFLRWTSGFAGHLNRKDDARLLRVKIPRMCEEKMNKEADLKKLKASGREILNLKEVVDKSLVRNDLADVDKKWEESGRLLVEYINAGASSEVEKLLKYLNETESKMNSMEPLSVNRDKLVDQLRTHQKLHSDLMAKKVSACEMMEEFSSWLQRDGNKDADTKMKLVNLMEQLNALVQSSISRLICLEDAVTLATHFDESLSDLKSWIGEVESDIASMETVADDSDQVHKLQDRAKATHHEIGDRFDSIESFRGTCSELKELCDDKGAEFVDAQLSDVCGRYAQCKEGNRRRLQDLQESIYNSNDEAFALLASLHGNLGFYKQMFAQSFRSSISQSALIQQVGDLQVMHDDLLKISHIVDQVKQEMTINNTIEEMNLLEKVELEEKDLEENVSGKKMELENVLKLVDEFENVYGGIMTSLQTIQDNFASQDYPGVEHSVVSDQLNEIALMEEDLQMVREMFATSDDIVDELSRRCDEAVAVELGKLLSNRDHIFGNVIEGLVARKQDLRAASRLSEKYGRHLQNVAEWLPRAEQKLRRIAGGDATNELKALKRELTSHFDDVVKLKDVLSAFRIISPPSTEVLTFEVNDIETRFNVMISSINESTQPGNLEVDSLRRQINEMSADTLSATERFWNARRLLEELDWLQRKSPDDDDDPVDGVALFAQLSETCEEMKTLKEKESQMEGLLRWFEDFKSDLIFLRALRSRPALLRSQVDHFENRNQEFKEKVGEAEKVMSELKELDAGIEVEYLVGMLDGTISNLKKISQETETKLQKHREEVERFDSLTDEHARQMTDIETSLTPPHQHNQLQNLEEIEGSLLVEKERIGDMRGRGSVLQFYGRKQDFVAVSSSLLDAQLRWKKLFRRMNDIKVKTSDDSNQKSKFRQQHADLLKTFEEIEERIKERDHLSDLLLLEEEIGRSERKLHDLNRTLRNMRVSPGDDDDLRPMVHDLKKKWNGIHSTLINKKNKLDLDLINSGKLSEAIKLQCDWLLKCIDYLDENQPLLGDLDTVAMLIDQYKNFQEDLHMHESVIRSIRNYNPLPPSIDQLNSLWDEVLRLNDARGDKLQEAQTLAVEFQEAVEKVRRFLPEIEDGLKEVGTNVESEEQLMSFLHHHQRLYDSLCDEQPNIERIVFMSDEILENCHPSAARFIQYYLTITKIRWEQAMMKSTSCMERLNDELSRLRGGATVIEDLWAWLTEAQQLLVTKSKDLPPSDLTTVDVLIRDHQDFHEDLINKNEEIEELAREAHSTSLSKSQVQALQNKWRNVWRLSVERKKMLQETLDHLLEVESFHNFNFEDWRQRYNDWIKMKKLRVTDFFRKQDTLGYGTLARNQFVDGMLNSKFPSNRMELNAVFDLFEDPATAEMLYQHLIEALKSDKMGPKGGKSESSTPVDDEVVSQISRCQCRKQFAAYKMGEGKYQFGEKGRTYFLRFVNGVVMVRVGGGWSTLHEFLQSSDPCRVKNRTNVEIYKTLQNRRKSSSSLNKSASGSTTSLNMSNQQTPKRSKTPQISNLAKNKNSPMNHSTTSLVSTKSKESDPRYAHKSSDSLRPTPKSPFVAPRRVSTPKSDRLNTSRELQRTPSSNLYKPASQR